MEEIKPCTLEVCTHYWIGCAKNCRATTIDKVSECSWYQRWNIRQTPDISGIEWVGECDTCTNWCRDITKPIPCHKCNGTGTITRPATIEEVLEIVRETMEWQTIAINNGQLKVRSQNEED